jgi:uncharacterized lipoprotein NlpE involved in copper resistance
MKQKKFLFSGAAVLLTAALILSGCPNPSDDPTTPAATSNGVTVSPSTVSVAKGGTQAFTAPGASPVRRPRPACGSFS